MEKDREVVRLDVERVMGAERAEVKYDGKKRYDGNGWKESAVLELLAGLNGLLIVPSTVCGTWSELYIC